jgi:hypothetical protein
MRSDSILMTNLALITIPSSHFQIPLHWGQGFDRWIWEGHTHLVHKTGLHVRSQGPCGRLHSSQGERTKHFSQEDPGQQLASLVSHLSAEGTTLIACVFLQHDKFICSLGPHPERPCPSLSMAGSWSPPQRGCSCHLMQRSLGAPFALNYLTLLYFPITFKMS